MTERVRKLREQSLATEPYIATERAELLTDFTESRAAAGHSVPVQRALAFRYVLEHKALYIGEGELIVGERGPAPKATPTYPELCCHSLEDFEIMSHRARTRFAVSEEAKRVYRERIIPFWAGRTIREQVFAALSPAWHAAFEAGVFTEFMEQRSPGHAIHDDKVYRLGLNGLKARIDESLARLDFLADPRAYDKREELRAIEIAADAVIAFAGRYAAEARRLAETEAAPARRAELLRIAEVCEHVPAEPPRNFHEALQAYWFVHLGIITELNTWDSFNPGRLDQHLRPFYARDLAEGTFSHDEMKELLECFWVKFNNQPAPPKVGITEEQSGTYTDFALINMGGLTPDGADAVNEVTYLMLDVTEEMRLVQPSTCVQVSERSPDRFVRRAAEVIRTGFGQPSCFNTEVLIQEMLRMGKSLEDARSGGASGCVEVSCFGKEACVLTGYMNWPKILELALHDGRDPRTGEQLGPRTGDPAGFGTFECLMAAYRAQLRHFVDLKIEGNSIIERIFATQMPSPMMSLLVDDCIAKGEDYHGAGPRYRGTYIQGVGLGTTTDSLASIRYHVYDRRTLSMDELLAALAGDFAECETLRQTFLNRTPRYGNDDAYADEVAKRVFEEYFEALDGRPNTKGGQYRVNLLPTTVHVYFGTLVGALPNGRPAGQPLSDGISPQHGADREGPTGVIHSAARIDHCRTGGTLLNMKFTPQALAGEAGLDGLVHLIRTYFAMKGHHIQFNVIGAETLREARERPADHRDLIVRVAGYSDYFTQLGPDLQQEIISRTEQHEL